MFFADVTFKNLTGLTRSEDASLKFYDMELAKQNATESGFKEFSSIYSNMFIEAWAKKKKENDNFSDQETEKLIRSSLKKAWKMYNESKD